MQLSIHEQAVDRGGHILMIKGVCNTVLPSVDDMHCKYLVCCGCMCVDVCICGCLCVDVYVSKCMCMCL